MMQRKDTAPAAQSLGESLRHLASRERLWRYPAMLLGVTVACYLGTLARADWPIEPNGKIIGRDYLAFYTGGALVADGRSDRLFDPALHHRFQVELIGDANPDWTGTYPYRNPPHYAWLMSKLVRLGYLGSLGAWTLLSVAAFALSATILLDWLPERNRALSLLLIVAVPPWFQALAGGQNTFFTLAILTAFCSLLIKRRDGLAGLVLSLLAYKFYLIAVPALILIAKRRWRAVAGLAAGGAATLLLTAAVFGPGVIADYTQFAFGQTRLMQEDGFDIHKQHCWYGAIQLLLTGVVPQSSIGILAASASLATLVLLIPVWTGRWDPDEPVFRIRLAVLMLATLITSPHLLHYDVTLAVLPAVLWASAAARAGRINWQERITPLLVLGFCWLAVAESIARFTHTQATPVLLLCWMIIGQRLVAGSAEPGESPAARPVAPAAQ